MYWGIDVVVVYRVALYYRAYKDKGFPLDRFRIPYVVVGLKVYFLAPLANHILANRNNIEE